MRTVWPKPPPLPLHSVSSIHRAFAERLDIAEYLSWNTATQSASINQHPGSTRVVSNLPHEVQNTVLHWLTGEPMLPCNWLRELRLHFNIGFSNCLSVRTTLCDGRHLSVVLSNFMLQSRTSTSTAHCTDCQHRRKSLTGMWGEVACTGFIAVQQSTGTAHCLPTSQKKSDWHKHGVTCTGC